jgi:hypothetical protein
MVGRKRLSVWSASTGDAKENGKKVAFGRGRPFGEGSEDDWGILEK